MSAVRHERLDALDYVRIHAMLINLLVWIIVGGVAGWLADEYSFGAAFAVTAVVLAVGLVAAIASRETRNRSQPEPDPESTSAQTPLT
jgi:dipeptide/tripeptide permease